MLKSPFGGTGTSDQCEIPENTDIILVSDMFVEDYSGGAEMTLQALIDSSPLNCHKIHSRDLTMNLLESGQNSFWIFGNFSGMNLELVPTVVANLDYSIIECDFKYCRYRSPEKHESNELKPCDCADDMHGKLMSAFFYGAKSLWWMSEGQMERYTSLFPFLAERPNTVLSSVFDEAFFLALKLLREKYEDQERKGWVVLGSPSWIKGYDAALEWCKTNEKDYTVLWDKSYEETLETLAQSEGFVYLPLGADTCPRMVIEAKLLGCELHINDNVQHKDELWFDTDDQFDTEAYLYAARDRFWRGIKADMEYSPSVSGYTTTLNCIRNEYPWQQCIQSLLGFCSEVIVVDGGSDDGTWEDLEKWASDDDRLKVHQVLRDWDHPRFAVFDGQQKSEARSRATGEYCWQQDADEVVHEDDYDKIKQLVRNFPPQVDLVSLPVVEYWGSSSKVRMDVNPWKWRLSRNKDHITHGIPKSLRKFDDSGNLYADQGTDGCDYIHKDTHQVIPHASFYNSDAHNLRMAGLAGDDESIKNFQKWFQMNVDMLPGVHHYSWFDLGRKIRTYRDYWSSHWQSLYDIEQDDTAENNMFFDKPWDDVTESDIDDMSQKLSDLMGGWVFHSRVDFDRPTPHLTLDIQQPKVMSDDE
jgi:glycosyltransferase involved in cell wall biosynthesis